VNKLSRGEIDCTELDRKKQIELEEKKKKQLIQRMKNDDI